jgi:hypothetical protein
LLNRPGKKAFCPELWPIAQSSEPLAAAKALQIRVGRLKTGPAANWAEKSLGAPAKRLSRRGKDPFPGSKDFAGADKAFCHHPEG